MTMDRRSFLKWLGKGSAAVVVVPATALSLVERYVPKPVPTVYDAIGIREQLSDIIYDISPMDTPFISLSTKGARYIEWQTDSLKPL